MDRPDSFTNVESIVGAENVPTLSIADALQQRESPVSLFTAALLFTRGGFDRDPVIEFDARFPAEQPDLRPFCIDVRKDHEFFFRGMGMMPAPGKSKPVCWDKRLYGIDATRAEECFSFLGGIAYSNPKVGLFAQSFNQPVFVRDPTSITPSFLSVTVFGVMSNRFVAFMAEHPGGTPVVRCVAATDQHLLPPSIQLAGLSSGFTGEDPLTMRDDK
jgi:hypothetical protein